MAIGTGNQALAVTGSFDAVLRVETDALGGIDVIGVPLCSGTTGTGDSTYECRQPGAITTVLSAPDEVSVEGDVWRLVRWAGCDAGVSNEANACTIAVAPGTTATVRAVYSSVAHGIAAVDRSAPAEGSATAIGVATGDVPVIAYYGKASRGGLLDCDRPDEPGNCDLRVAACDDPACTSRRVTVVDETGDVGLYASMAIAPDGLPVVSYYEGRSRTVAGSAGRYYRYCDNPSLSPNEFCNLKILKCGNVACTAGNSIVRADNTGAVGSYTSIAIGSDGLPVVSYTGGPYGNADLKVLKCGNPACSSGNSIATVEGADTAGIFFTSIAISGNGMPIISYTSFDFTTGAVELRVVSCGTSSCMAGNVVTTISQERSGGFLLVRRASLAVGADGLPMVAYYREYSPTGELIQDLEIVKCHDSRCTAFASSVADDDGDVGIAAAISTASDGTSILYGKRHPLGMLTELRVLSCADASCEQRGEPVTVDGGGGDATSLTMNERGLPVAAYLQYDPLLSENVVRVLRCGAPDCRSAITARGI